MNSSKHIGEILFYIISILICLIAIFFLFNLLKYDDCKYIKESDANFYEGKILDFNESRGTLYITFEGYQDTQFKVELSSFVNEKNFKNSINKKEKFKVGYSTNTMYKDIIEIVYLESEDNVLVSTESRKNSVTFNLIMYILSIIGLFVFVIFLSVKLFSK